MTPTAIIAYLALFAGVGFAFVFGALLLGRVMRPHVPSATKQEIYECGEPSVGSGFVQFDLRFYVVALVFLIFEVEVAFFFLPATIFGKANQLRNPAVALTAPAAKSDAGASDVQLSPAAVAVYQSLGVSEAAMPSVSDGCVVTEIGRQARILAMASMFDLGVFFVVLLVGFAYVWRRGDLDWVRATRHPATVVETATMVMKIRGDR